MFGRNFRRMKYWFGDFNISFNGYCIVQKKWVQIREYYVDIKNIVKDI